MSENLEKTVRSGKLYYPTPENKREIKAKAYWAGFKLWLMLIVVGVAFWVAGLVIDLAEYPVIYKIVSYVNNSLFILLSTAMAFAEPVFELIQSVVSSLGSPRYEFEISMGIFILIGMIALYVLPYAFYPMYYPWSKKQVGLDYHCDSCSKDWVLEWTGNKQLYDVQKSYTNTQETELQLLGDKKRDVDKQQEYTNKFYEYEWLCKHCNEITLKRGVESRMNKETVTSRSNWYKD